MRSIFYCFASHLYYFGLEIYDKTIIGFSFWFFPLEMYNKKIIKSFIKQNLPNSIILHVKMEDLRSGV